MNPSSKKNPRLLQISAEKAEGFRVPQISNEPDPILAADGWERRQVVGPERVAETTQLYQDIGFEVRTEEVKTSEFDSCCQGCATVASDNFTTIYTRKVSKS